MAGMREHVQCSNDLFMDDSNHDYSENFMSVRILPNSFTLNYAKRHTVQDSQRL